MARIWVVIVFIIMGQFIEAQIPAEIGLWVKGRLIDGMFLSILKEENSRWLFFHRNRTSVDVLYIVAPTVGTFWVYRGHSYNVPALKGLAPVAVLSVLNGGLTQGRCAVCFDPSSIYPLTWAVASLQQNTVLDFFYWYVIHPLYQQKKRFLQLKCQYHCHWEATSTHLPCVPRMGLKHHHFQWGWAWISHT